MARSRRLIIIRRLLDVGREAPAVLPPPKLVLHVIADDPNDSPRNQFEKLSQTECRIIRQAIGCEQYTLVAKPGTVAGMEAKLGGKQILHFLGHAALTPVDGASVLPAESGRGYLKFINHAGCPEPLTGEQLQLRLAASSDVQLVVLNGCHGDAATKIALELTYRGMPYVVTMQAQLQPKAAEFFMQAFYKALQEGKPVDRAVALGRAKITKQLPDDSDWCLPTLYTSVVGEEGPAIFAWPEISKMQHSIWQSVAQFGQGLSPKASLQLGLLFLMVGFLLLISNAAPPLLDLSFLLPAITWLAPLPLLVAIAAYLFIALSASRTAQSKTPATWQHKTRAALMMHLFASASSGLGFALFSLLWLAMILLSSFGFWAMLSPTMPFLLLIATFAFSLLASYAQALTDGRTFLTHPQVEAKIFNREQLARLALGYLLIIAPWAIWLAWPSLLAPPVGTLLIGGILTAIYVFEKAGWNKWWLNCIRIYRG